MLVHIPPAVTFRASSVGGQSAFPAASRDLIQILEAIVESGYYTSNPEEACIFVPALDTLSESQLANSSLASAALQSSSPYWNKGRNHLIFTPYPAAKDSLSTGNNQVASLTYFSIKRNGPVILW